MLDHTAVDRLSNEISEVTVDTAEHTVQFTREFSDTQELSVKLQILYPSTEEDTFSGYSGMEDRSH